MSSDNYIEVTPNEILCRSTKSRLLASDPKIRELPLESIPWEDFEELALRLFEKNRKPKDLQVFRYGNIGQSQHGLDLIALDLDCNKHVVGQCKRVKRISNKDITDWVDRFLAGEKAASTSQYILITSHPIRKTQLIDTWHSEQKRLKKQGICSELWDYHDILQKLREEPTVVELFYGFETSERFC